MFPPRRVLGKDRVRTAAFAAVTAVLALGLADRFTGMKPPLPLSAIVVGLVSLGAGHAGGGRRLAGRQVTGILAVS